MASSSLFWEGFECVSPKPYKNPKPDQISIDFWGALLRLSPHSWSLRSRLAGVVPACGFRVPRVGGMSGEFQKSTGAFNHPAIPNHSPVQNRIELG